MSSLLKDLLSAFSDGAPGRVAITATSTGAALEEDKLIQFVIPTWGDSNNVLILPSPMPGKVVIVAGAETGGKLRSSATSVIDINGATDVDIAVDANTMVVAICQSTTGWKEFALASDGSIENVGVVVPPIESVSFDSTAITFDSTTITWDAT